MLIDRTRVLTLARQPEVLALLAGVTAVLVGFLVVGGGAGHPRVPLPAAPVRTPARAPGLAARPSDIASAIGAVRAATEDLSALSAAGVSSSGQARRVVAAVVTGSLQAKLERSLPAVASEVQARLRGLRTPHVFDGWPLGYRVESFETSHATVAVWHLDVGASSALGLMSAQYTTTTYDLRWIEGSWRIAAVSSVPGPTPPSTSAPAPEVDEFAREINALSPYSNVP